MKAGDFLKEQLEKEILLYERQVSNLDKNVFEEILERWSNDSKNTEGHRYELLNYLIPDLQSKKILDMAAGCGSFVIQGLRNGYDTYGVEPEDWKHELIDIKFEENNYPNEWRNRLKKGIGEDLPFDDNSFDVIDSWQTIEHVDNEEECIKEFYRVLKNGGCAILRGPDYFCFNEGHYRMLWFPMLHPKSRFAKWYVKMRKRPLGGLNTFHPVNPFKLRKYCRKAGFKIVDIKRKILYNAAKRRFPILKKKLFYPALLIIYLIWDLSFWLKNFGLGQCTISYMLIKK
jgi:ubiquinone/menaquinone biosynthesis C-methylase UbiE